MPSFPQLPILSSLTVSFSFSFLRFFPHLEPLPFPLGLSDLNPQPLPPLPPDSWEHSFKDLQATETAECLLCLPRVPRRGTWSPPEFQIQLCD